MESDLTQLTVRALSALPQAVLVVDAGGRIVLRNEAAREILPDGERIGSVLHTGEGSCELDWPGEKADLTEAQGRLVRRNVTLSGRQQRRIVADLYLRVLTDGSDGRDEATLVVVEDVSPRVMVGRQQIAWQRSQAVGTLLAKLAHEINNPLDGSMRYLGLAERVAGPQAEAYLRGAREGLQRITHLLGELQDDRRLRGSGGERALVERLLADAITTCQPRAQSRGVSVVCDIADDASTPVSRAVYQVFCNVINNALDAMPQGGRLTIRARRVGDEVILEFGDTGCGVQSEQVERVFEPFYTTKSPGEGAGLGLAICRETLRRCDGSIVLSAAPDRGAVVTITLPLAVEAVGGVGR